MQESRECGLEQEDELNSVSQMEKILKTELKEEKIYKNCAENKEQKKKIDLWELSFLMIYGVIFFRDCLATTMFEIDVPQKISWAFLLILMVYTGAKMLWHNTYTKREWWISGIVLALSLLVGVVSDYHVIIYIAFFIVGAKDVDFKKILWVYVLETIVILLAAFIAAKMGLILDIVNPSTRTAGVWRHAFGCLYPTDFAAHIFYLVAALISLRNQRITWWKVLLPILGAIFVYVFCEGFTGTMTMMGLAFLMILFQLVGRWEGLKKAYLNIATYFVLLPCVVFLAMANLYQAGTPIWDKLNSLLSLRLEFSSKAIHDYGYSLLGTFIEETGLGGMQGGSDVNFFLDDSYIRFLLEYGIIAFFVIMVYFIFLNKRLVKEEAYLFLIIWVAIAVHSFMEHHMIEVAYNPFILCLYANLGNCLKDETGLNKIKRQ